MDPATASLHLLVIDDDALIRESLRDFFRQRGDVVIEADSVASARRLGRSAQIDAAVVDYQLPDGDGLEVLRALRSVEAAVPVVLLTGHGSIALAVEAMREGADQFFTKPVDLPTLAVVLERLVAQRRRNQASLALRSRSARDALDPFLGESVAIRELEDQARRLVDSSACVLLLGETGAGKGVLARWLHQNGPRAGEAFVDVNCAGLTTELLDSELFGHEKGAFTGALSAKPGLFEVADKGTLFLDEVGDADSQVQAKLLKVLEERRFRRLGGVRELRVDVRLLVATHHELPELVRKGSFREDLLYRISALPLRMPPLRERGRDVLLIADRVLERLSAEVGYPGVRLTPEAQEALLAHRWPGNLRELRNRLERALLLGNRHELTAADLVGSAAPSPAVAPQRELVTLREAEKRYLEEVLSQLGGDVRRAAAVLGLSRSALYEKIKKHGLVLSAPTH